MKKQIELEGTDMTEFLEGVTFKDGVPNLKLSHITGGVKKIKEDDEGKDFITLHFEIKE